MIMLYLSVAASDDLYQMFLESMQTHASAREVFDTIAEFVHNCTNTLEIMRETHNAKVVLKKFKY